MTNKKSGSSISCNIVYTPHEHTQHGAVHCYLLQIKLPLNFREVTGVIKDGLGQLVLYVGQPGAKAVHVFIQLLYSHQSFSELLHSVNRKK